MRFVSYDSPLRSIYPSTSSAARYLWLANGRSNRTCSFSQYEFIAEMSGPTFDRSEVYGGKNQSSPYVCASHVYSGEALQAQKVPRAKTAGAGFYGPTARSPSLKSKVETDALNIETLRVRETSSPRDRHGSHTSRTGARFCSYGRDAFQETSVRVREFPGFEESRPETLRTDTKGDQ